MQPLKILAFVIGAVPIVAFLLTMLLTEGAPLQPLSPGEESGPAVATPVLPRAKLERHDGVAAAGHSGADRETVERWRAKDGLADEIGAVSSPVVNAERDAQLLLMLFGAPQPGLPPEG